MNKWKIQWWEIPSNFKSEEVTLTTKESPEEALSVIEEFLKSGSFVKVEKTDTELHMVSGHTNSLGCMGALLYLILCIASFGFALIGLFLLFLIPSPDVQVEAKRVKWGKGRATKLTIKGNPPKAIMLAEKHLRENLSLVAT